MRKGFTLIELLIVIAIIAILALIAIPNFLEAQTRSKVSRAQADMRTIATALESYFVDYNSYIWSAHDNTGIPAGSATQRAAANRYYWYRHMTTPVSYITDVPRDPFGNTLPVLKNRGYLQLFTGGLVAINTNNTPVDCPVKTDSRNQWLLLSVGPDGVNDIKNQLVDCGPAATATPSPTKDYAFLDVTDEDGSVTVKTGKFTTAFPYDPSNGTLSLGDVVRVSGGKLTSRYLRFRKDDAE